jgi:antitoxin component YwqK of YwqJK toxin-antitoxin module
MFSCSEQIVEEKNEISVSSEFLKEDAEKSKIEDSKELVKNGEFLEKYPNGNIQTEGWHDEDGKRTGVWYSYYENGVKWSSLNYLKGLKNGHSVVFYPNGKTRYLGEYKDDIKTGHWIFYDETGEITNEEDY